MIQKRIAFVGNCQAGSIAHFYRAFVGVPDRQEVRMVDDTWVDRAAVLAAVQDADVVVAQVREFNDVLGPDALRPGVELHLFPMLLQAYLWPYAHEAHVRNGPEPPLPDGPYPGQLSDSFLNRLITQGVAPHEALERYRAHDIAKGAHLERLYELHMAQQYERDARTGYAFAPMLEADFRREALFMSPHHPNRRVFGALMSQLFDQMGVAANVTAAAASAMLKPPFPSGELPLHPGVISHFGLGFADDQTRYAFHAEGRFTFDEYVLRYMTYAHNHDLRAGLYQVHNHDLPGGVESLERGLRLSPQSEFGWRTKGLALHHLGRPEEAVQAYRQATQADPQDPESWRDYAEELFVTGRGEEAVRAVQTAIALAPDFGHAHLLLAEIGDRLQDFATAVEAGRHAERLLPGQLDAMAWRAITLLRSGDEVGAIAAAEATIAKHPQASRGHNMLAEAHEAHGRRAEAIAALDACVAEASPDAQTFSLLGNYHLRDGNLEAALLAFERGLEIEPGRSDLQDQTRQTRERLMVSA